MRNAIVSGLAPVTNTAAAVRERRRPAYETARPDVQAHVPVTARTILDLGCSSGALGAGLKARQGAVVVGVELDPGCAADAESRLDRVVVADVESFLAAEAPPEAPFDCVVVADVLEHLVDPWTVLARAVDLLSPGGTAVVSLPNILHWASLLRLLRERRWPRDDAGVFDRTHLRWFSRDDAVALLVGAGLEVTRVEPRYWQRGAPLRLLRALGRTPLSAYLAPQYVLSARKPPAPR